MEGTHWHTCPEGHTWRAHPNGTVAPSWGLGGTEAFPDRDPNLCPEPARHDVPNHAIIDRRGVECPACGHKGLPWDMYPNLSGVPWQVREDHERCGCVHKYPVPVCGLPPVFSRVWLKGHWVFVSPEDYALSKADPGEQIPLEVG